MCPNEGTNDTLCDLSVWYVQTYVRTIWIRAEEVTLSDMFTIFIRALQPDPVLSPRDYIHHIGLCLPLPVHEDIWCLHLCVVVFDVDCDVVWFLVAMAIFYFPVNASFVTRQ